MCGSGVEGIQTDPNFLLRLVSTRTISEDQLTRRACNRAVEYSEPERPE